MSRVQRQGNFGHLLRQRPSSLSGDARELRQLQVVANQVVTRQRPHSEDLQLHQELLDQEDEDEEDDDDVFLLSEAGGEGLRGRRQRHGSTSNSNEELSDEDEARWVQPGAAWAGGAGPKLLHLGLLLSSLPFRSSPLPSRGVLYSEECRRRNVEAISK